MPLCCVHQQVVSFLAKEYNKELDINNVECERLEVIEACLACYADESGRLHYRWVCESAA